MQNEWTEAAIDDDEVNINVVNTQNKPAKKSKRKATSVAEQADLSVVQRSAKKRKVDCSSESERISELGIESGSSTSEEKKKKKRKKAADTENPDSFISDSVSNGCAEVELCASEISNKENSQQKTSEHYKQQSVSEAADGSFDNYRISAKLCEQLKGDTAFLIVNFGSCGSSIYQLICIVDVFFFSCCKLTK